MVTKDDVIDSAFRKIVNRFKIENLKKEQRGILDCLLNGRDCMAILLTDFGKSLPYQMLPSVKREITVGQELDLCKVLICSPLVGLMEDQVSKLKNIEGLTAEYKACQPVE
ncbi:ATP-dependent DNA helicase RecS [Mizuhopecten yessoensis]|uniref:ATP-dependent DNA helicase RecS n=1 Tax=Mizuhopecten yessoensis TaxID=6573 RepID=A0A210QPA5_MIZYE|nr:ATP-dependent DNA helicase RecS [Mizuhopecten yessoensis]